METDTRVRKDQVQLDQIDEKSEMPFLDHLEELRWRIIRSAIAIVIGSVIALIFSDFLFDVIIFGPLTDWFPTNQFLCTMSDGFCESLLGDGEKKMQAIDLTAEISSFVMTGLIAGLILAFPYVFSQVWGFISPGLKEKEQKQAKGMTFWMSLLFFLGILFGYFVLVPIAMRFFYTFSISDMVVKEFKFDKVVSAVSIWTLISGILFQLPIVIYVFTKLGLIGPDILKKYRKHALVAVLVLAALITPPDFFSQVLITIPIMLLYEIGIFIAKRVVKNQQKAAMN